MVGRLGGEPYIANRDPSGTWRILETGHPDVLRGTLDFEDDVPDDHPALKLVKEGEYLAIIKEASRLGMLLDYGGYNPESEEKLYALEEETAEQQRVIAEFQQQIADLQLELRQANDAASDLKKRIEVAQSKPNYSEKFELKKLAIDGILRLTALQELGSANEIT